MAQGGDLGQHDGASARCATTATRTRCVALVDPAGPACHTGERTLLLPRRHGRRSRARRSPALERTIAERKAAGDTASSYTAELLADPPLIGEKVREEAEEVTRAAREESDERVAEEAADVLYHLAVLLASRGPGLADAFEVLNDRRR